MRNLVGEAAEGNHGETGVLDLGELVPLEVLLVGALRAHRERVRGNHSTREGESKG